MSTYSMDLDVLNFTALKIFSDEYKRRTLIHHYTLADTYNDNCIPVHII
jgi:hypothetical protein